MKAGPSPPCRVIVPAVESIEAAALALREGCESYGVPGAQLGLMRGDERVVVCAGDAIDPATPFRAGSIAKAVAAALVLDAAARGELDVDVAAREQGAGDGWPETPRTLMAHRSGRPNLLPADEESLTAFTDRVAALPLVHPPGRFSYSNAVWSVIDRVLEHSTGSGFERLAVERVFEPLAMTGRFEEPADGAPGHAVSAPGEAPRPVSFAAGPAASAAGSRWWATADDLLRFARRQLDAGPAATEQRRWHADVPGRGFADGWALGWALWDRGPYQAFGWSGYTSGHLAFLRIFPEQDAALALLTNCAGPLLGGAGGSAVFDHVAPACWRLLGVGAPVLPSGGAGARSRPWRVLRSGHGRRCGRRHAVRPRAGDGDRRARCPHAPPRRHVRDDDHPLGGMSLAFDDNLLYFGPFALPRER